VRRRLITGVAIGSIVGLAVAGVALALSGDADTDAPNMLIGLSVLALTFVTLTLQLAPGRLLVERQDELGLSDLIFYVRDPVHDLAAAPADFLFQLHAAVMNVGARKLVVSKLQLVELLDERSRPVRIPTVALPVQAHIAVMHHTYTGGAPQLEVELLHPPIVIGPDEVLTMRFRFRRGVTWVQGQSTLEDLRELAQALESPVAKAKLRATWRRGQQVRINEWVVPVRTEQQERYRALLGELTHDFTQWPAKVHSGAIQFE
jgi:hypothetical protein